MSINIRHVAILMQVSKCHPHPQQQQQGLHPPFFVFFLGVEGRVSIAVRVVPNISLVVVFVSLQFAAELGWSSLEKGVASFLGFWGHVKEAGEFPAHLGNAGRSVLIGIESRFAAGNGSG